MVKAAFAFGVVSLLMAAVATSGWSAEFIPLGADASVSAVSDDGLWVTGSKVLPGQPPGSIEDPPIRGAYRWRRSTGVVILDPREFSHGKAISDNGDVIGSSRPWPLESGPFLWSYETGLIDLGQLPGLSDRGYGTDISADGRVIVGGVGEALFDPGSGTFTEAFRWTKEAGMVGLGDLPGGAFRSFATAVSRDGNVIVGEGTYAGGVGGEAFRWTAETGLEGLGFLDGLIQSSALDVSSHGKVVVGFASGLQLPTSAFRWVEGVGMSGLGFSVARGVTGNGQVVVGYGTDAFGEQAAIIWDPQHGARILQDELATEFGLANALAGWDLTNAIDISADGRTIIGVGVNPFGQFEPWIFTTAVPEANLGAMWLAFAALCHRRMGSDCAVRLQHHSRVRSQF